MKRLLSAICIAVLIAALSLPVFAADSVTDTFTHHGNKTAATRPVYEAVGTVTMRSLGLTEDAGVIEDIGCDEKGNTYLLTDAGRLLCFDAGLRLIHDYEVINETGAKVNISGARGLYIHSASEIYIADAKNARVLQLTPVSDTGLSVVKEITLPKSALIPSDFVFKPVRVVRDGEGFLYVLSEGSYYGAVLYDPDGNFSGFFGANTVKGNILSTLSYFWDRLTMNDVMRGKIRKQLPYQFSDIAIDSSGFVYTATGVNADSSTGQIRMLSPGGASILAGAESTNFGESDRAQRLGKTVQQNFTGVGADGEGFIYALDKAFGLIYIYDTSGNILAAFGGGMGQGRQEGIFSSASSIAITGRRLMVSDSLRGSVTVFERTEFGELLMEAQRRTLAADYMGAKPLWESVLAQDSLNRMALTGLAKAAFMEEKYVLSASLAKRGGDGATYSQAREKLQNIFISANFLWLFPLILLMTGAIVALLIVTAKRKAVLIPHPGLRTLARGMIHPFQSFGDIKYKKMGSMRIALILTVLFYLSSAAATIWSDFRFTNYDTATYNSLFQIVQTAGLVALWSVANWGISTLQEGKGRLKEVFTVSAYATLPLILYNLISTPLTHILAAGGETFLSGLHTLALIFTGVMLTVGLMVIHDFSFPRFLFSAFITVLFMILVIFVLFMLGILLTQFWSFMVKAVLEGFRAAGD